MCYYIYHNFVFLQPYLNVKKKKKKKKQQRRISGECLFFVCFINNVPDS
jgi:hypothetical protein